MPRLLYTRLRSHLYLFYCKGGGPSSPSGRLGDKKNLSLLLVIHGTSSIIPSHYIDCGNPVIRFRIYLFVIFASLI